MSVHLPLSYVHQTFAHPVVFTYEEHVYDNYHHLESNDREGEHDLADVLVLTGDGYGVEDT